RCLLMMYECASNGSSSAGQTMIFGVYGSTGYLAMSLGMPSPSYCCWKATGSGITGVALSLNTAVGQRNGGALLVPSEVYRPRASSNSPTGTSQPLELFE